MYWLISFGNGMTTFDQLVYYRFYCDMLQLSYTNGKQLSVRQIICWNYDTRQRLPLQTNIINNS